jgi:putative tricarboxylic transport membrane protein
MSRVRLRPFVPYLLILVLCAVLFWFARHIDFHQRPGVLGPDFWPSVAILLIAVAAIAQIVSLAINPASEHFQALGEEFEQEAEGEMATPDEEPRRPLLLAGGIALVLGYAVALPVLGFMLATFLLMVLFMYLGGIRSHFVIWGSSFLGMLAVAIIFWKIAYISVPRGQPPFDQVTQFIQTLLLVR